ncbi:hypothetical protein CHS0354_029983, partial [Potamilus streckersoni]
NVNLCRANLAVIITIWGTKNADESVAFIKDYVDINTVSEVKISRHELRGDLIMNRNRIQLVEEPIDDEKKSTHNKDKKFRDIKVVSGNVKLTNKYINISPDKYTL